MIPAFLITLREVIEASLIVATILGILTRLDKKEYIKTVWSATGAAIAISVLLLIFGSIMGLKVQELYSGRTEEIIEGILMIVSAVFITWAVFFLHNYFGKYKVALLQKIQSTVHSPERKSLFILVFTAVFREGFEIVLFLSTIYFSSSPTSILTGFSAGVLLGLVISFGFFTATLRLPVYAAFRITSALLIVFAAGLLARGVHEFAEAGIIAEASKIQFHFLPETSTFTGAMVKSLFGLTQSMDILQIALYSGYVLIMGWWVFVRPQRHIPLHTDS